MEADDNKRLCVVDDEPQTNDWPHLLCHTGMIFDIVEKLGGQHCTTALRETCREFRRSIPVPKKTTTELLVLFSIVDDNPDALKVGVKSIAEDKRRDVWRWSLSAAADYGAIKCCYLAKEEGGATNFDEMLRGASRYGHCGLCKLAKEWGATDWDGMLSNAISGGAYDMARLAIDWGATNITSLFAGY